MVLQRDKPIVIWGWSEPGATVSVHLGGEKAVATAGAGKGRWEVTFPAREASGRPQTLVVTAGDEKVGGKPSLPLHSFRSDEWDYPESDDPTAPIDGANDKQMTSEATERLEQRRVEEARRAVEILERVETLGQAAGKGPGHGDSHRRCRSRQRDRCRRTAELVA